MRNKLLLSVIPLVVALDHLLETDVELQVIVHLIKMTLSLFVSI